MYCRFMTGTAQILHRSEVLDAAGYFGDSVRSTGNQLLIVFVSDEEVGKTGFLATVAFRRGKSDIIFM